MRRRTVSLALMVVTVAAAASLAPVPAKAEWLTDVYLGLSITSKADMDFAPTTPRTFIPQTFKDVNYDNSVVWGVRGGYWFGSKDALGKPDMLGDLAQYLGASLDLSYFRPRIPSQVLKTDVGTRRLGFMDLSVVTLTPQILVRFPVLRDEEYPQGRLHPYLAFGPTLYVTSLTDSAGNFGPRGKTERDAGIGLLAGPGVAFQLADHFFAFTEVRFLHARPSFGFKGGDTDVPINGNQIILGVSYRF